MADNNYRIRFMSNNLASLNVNAFTFSSETSGFPATNAFTSFRSEIWKTSGYFLVTAGVDDTIHFDSTSATVAAGEYATPDLLATAIQTALNGVGSGFTVTYSLTAGSYKFTFVNASSFTLELSDQTTAIWNKIGFTGTTDLTGTSIDAQEQRAHDPVTGEFITLDFGGILPVTFASIISDVSQSFGLSSSATVTLEGNNINNFTSPPFTKTLEVNSEGIFEFNVTEPQATYRFWRFRFLDTYNSVLGPNLEFGNIYLGDYETLTSANIEAGFSDTLEDPSRRSESDGGVLYFDKRTKYTKLNNLSIRYLLDVDKQTIKGLFRTVGTTEPFYISLDPLNNINDDITEFTKFVIFDSEPKFISLGACYFSTILNLREVV